MGRKQDEQSRKQNAEDSTHSRSHGHVHSHSHEHGASCSHDHDGVLNSHHSQHLKNTPAKIFLIGISLNLIFVCVELFFGFREDSLALISDAFHNTADVSALILSWLGFYLSRKRDTNRFSLTAAIINSTVLILGCLWVFYEAVEKFNAPAAPAGKILMLVAGIGFFINFYSAKLFHHDLHHDLNMKSAYLHLMADAAVSLGVVLTGLILLFVKWSWLDSVVSIIISAVILLTSVKLLRQAISQLRG